MQIMYSNKNAMALPSHDNSTPSFEGSWSDLLLRLRSTLASAKNQHGAAVFTQIPELSSNIPLELTERFRIKNPDAKRTKALLIGINYSHLDRGQLRGSHNDAKTIRKFLTRMGFSDTPATMKLVMDNGDRGVDQPTRKNIIKAIKWLVKGAKPGDSLFMSYAGHGSQVEDVSGDEVGSNFCSDVVGCEIVSHLWAGERVRSNHGAYGLPGFPRQNRAHTR
jgi:hypothetical protein